MRLDGLLAEAHLKESDLLETVVGDVTSDVRGLTMDSRRVMAGALFACVPGQARDGHDFASAAVAGGAAALLTERPLDLDVAQIVVPSVRRALGPLADAFFDHPSRRPDGRGRHGHQRQDDDVCPAAGRVLGPRLGHRDHRHTHPAAHHAGGARLATTTRRLAR